MGTHDLKNLTTSALLKALANPTPYLKKDRYILCIKPADVDEIPWAYTTVASPPTDKPLLIHGLHLVANPDPEIPAPTPYLTLSGDRITLDHVTLTGTGPNIAGSVGIKLDGDGHQVMNSEITGFATAIEAGCAGASDPAAAVVGEEIPPNPPFAKGGNDAVCTIGPGNTFGKTGINDQQRVGVGVHVPATGQNVTVTQNQMATLRENEIEDLATKYSDRLRLAPGANGGVQPPPVVYAPQEQATVWVERSADQLTYTRLVGVLPAEGTLELFRELPHAFLQSCLVTQRGEQYPALPVNADTWLYDCNGLQLPIVKTTRVTIVYTHAGHSAPYQTVRLDDRSPLPMLPVPVGDPIDSALPVPGSAASEGSVTDDTGAVTGETVALVTEPSGETLPQADEPASMPPIYPPTPPALPPLAVTPPSTALPQDPSGAGTDTNDTRSATAMTGTAGAAPPLAGCSLMLNRR